MVKNNQPTNILTLIIMVLVLLAMMFFSYDFYIRLTSVNNVYEAQLIEFKPVSAESFSAIKELKACGNWPLLSVNASVNRGNPFSKKNEASPVMTAVSVPQCLPVTQ